MDENEILTAEAPVSEEETEGDLPVGEEPLTEEEEAPSVDYEAQARDDLLALKREFPELSSLTSLTEIKNPTRFGALRELGLTVREAYLATNERPAPRPNNRSHLHSAVPRARGTAGADLTAEQMASARELFGSLTDGEIVRLYRKVNS